MKTSRDPRLLQLVTWAVANGARTFRQVRVADDGALMATRHIAAFDIALAVPQSLTFSFLDVMRATDFPHQLKVPPQRYAAPPPWWPQVNWGTFALTALCTRLTLKPDVDPGRSAQLSIMRDLGCHDVGLVHNDGDDGHHRRRLPMLFNSALRATETAGYRSATESLVKDLGVDRADFDEEFCRHYCSIRRLAAPLWNQSRQGSSLIATTAYGAADVPAGDILGLTPLIDQATHSHEPNVCLGTPDSETATWMVEDLGVKAGVEYVVLQTLRPIVPGERLTLDRNASFGFPPETFYSWFGVHLNPAAEAAALAAEPRRASVQEGGAAAAEPTRSAAPTTDAAAADIFF